MRGPEKMKRSFVTVTAAVALFILISGIFGWMVWMDYLNALKHETNRYAVIEDVNGDHIAVEPTSDTVWEQLVQLYENKTVRWIGSIVEQYDNKWGFRFNPENITIAEVTAEGLHATIKYITENLDYWLNGWAYVSAKVTEIHSTRFV